MKEAMFYQKLPGDKVHCGLCRFRCLIGEGRRGVCGVRENRGGILYSLVYGKAVAEHVDPIEKKPLFHVQPGSTSYSVATVGCNFRCLHCQNYSISQAGGEGFRIPGTNLSPEEIVRNAVAAGCSSISYTYTEPTIFYEYVMDTAAAGRAAGVKSAVVSGGYIQQDPLKELCKHVDAIKIDLKAFSEKFYAEVVNGEMKPVLEALVTMRKLGMWTEIVYLVVPTLNDSEQEFRGMAKWVKGNLGTEVPVHFSMFHPEYLLKNLPVTPLATVALAAAHGAPECEGLRRRARHHEPPHGLRPGHLHAQHVDAGRQTRRRRRKDVRRRAEPDHS